MDITTLKTEFAAKNEVRANAYDALVSHIRNVLEANIEHITEKNILFKEDYGKRTKKDELIENILSNKWEIAV